MSWHDPELYLFLCVLAGLAALLAITYELVSRRRKPPVILTKAMPPDGLNESGPWSKPMTAVADLALPASMPDFPPSAQTSGRAIQSALRGHQGRAAEGASKPRA